MREWNSLEAGRTRLEIDSQLIFCTQHEQIRIQHKLKPFTCRETQLEPEVELIKSVGMSELIPAWLHQHFQHPKSSATLVGLSALLLNVDSEAKLKDSNVELRFDASAVTAQDEQSVLHLIGLKMSLRADEDQNVVNLTLIDASDEFRDDIFDLPIGFGCSITALRLQLAKIDNFKLETAHRMKYLIDVSLFEPQQSPKVDSQVGFSQLLLVSDGIDKTITAISRIGQNSSSTSFFDFKNNRKWLIEESTRTCQGPSSIPASSNLFAKQSTSSNSCQEVAGVELHLSSTFTLDLNRDSLKLITFAMQNGKNSSQLLQMRQLEASKFLLTYEMPVEVPICIYNSSRKVSIAAASLISEFIYQNSGSSHVWTPKSSSILAFADPERSQPLMRLKFDLQLMESYEPWKESRRLLDLSHCKKGNKQSAILQLEYPLEESRRRLIHLRNVRESLRFSMSTYLRMSFMLNLARVPQIEVQLKQDSILVKVKILERDHLLVDSDLLEAKSRSDEEFLALLRQSTRSVISASEFACAEYCQHYNCLIYIFCSAHQSCYIFSHDRARILLGESVSPSSHRDCKAFQVRAARVELANSWRKNSWSLSDILESIVGAVESRLEFSSIQADQQETGDLIEDSVQLAKSRVRRPTLEVEPFEFNQTEQTEKRLDVVRLEPSLATFQYQKLDSATQQVLMDKFRIAKTGFRLKPSSSSNRQPTIHAHLELDESDGHLQLEGFDRIDDCARACLNDISCESFSHCSRLGWSRCIISRLDGKQISKLFQSYLEEVSAEDATLELVENGDCNVLIRTHLDQFESLEVKQLLDYEAHRMDDVIRVFPSDEPEVCASECVKNRAESAFATCLSFDFCSSNEAGKPSACILFNRHLVSHSEHLQHVRGDHKQDLKLEIGDSSIDLLSILVSNGMSASGTCQHFVRDFLADFVKFNNRKLSHNLKASTIKNYQTPEDDLGEELEGNFRDEVQVEEQISLASCARQCEESAICGAFEFCTSNYPLAPSGLYLSCSLGNSLSLPNKQLDSGQLLKSRVCAVYSYQSLALQARMKQRKLFEGSKLRPDQIPELNLLRFVKVDLLVLLVFFVLSFLLYDRHLLKVAWRKVRSSSKLEAPKWTQRLRRENSSALALDESSGYQMEEIN